MKSIYIKRLDNMLGAQCDVVEFKRPDCYLVTRLIVPNVYRRRGHGTALLKEVCDDADRTGAELCLAVSSYGAMSNEQLEQYFIHRGFTRIRPDQPGLLGRMPQRVRPQENLEHPD